MTPSGFTIQFVPKLVIQKSAVITSEVKTKIWSGTFKKFAPNPQVFIQTARWHSTRSDLLRNVYTLLVY
jgi:hypothetical protein